MKYTAQNLAKAFLRIIEENPDNSKLIVDNFIQFCKEKHLMYLIPNFLKYLNLDIKKLENSKTLRIFSPIETNKDVIKNIRESVRATESDNIELIEDKDIIAGFIAYYKNKIIDASLVNNLHLLKNKLINN